MQTKKKHYTYVIAAAYIFAAIVMSISGDVPTSAKAIAGYIGGGFGLAIIPLIAMRLLGNAVGWSVLALLCLGYSQTQLNWLGTDRNTVAAEVDRMAIAANA